MPADLAPPCPTSSTSRRHDGRIVARLAAAAIVRAPSRLCRKYYLFGLRVRVRARFTRYDFCQVMDAMSLFAARGFAARGIPVLLDVNEIPDPFERQGRHFVNAPSTAKRHLAQAFARDIGTTTRIIATSDSMADVVAERFAREAVPIGNSRWPLEGGPSAQIRIDVGAGPEARILVYPCTAAPHLGVETAIELLRRLPDRYALVFVGRFANLPYRETIERLIRHHGMDRRVLLKGELPDQDYLRYIAGADIGLVPLSFAYRNQRVVLPWRVIDLAVAGVPIVASPSDEIRRVARHYDIGELAASDGVEDLLAAVRRLEAASSERRSAIRRDLFAIGEWFSPPRQLARYRFVIEGVAPMRGGRAAFVVNLALRHNRRLVSFVDELCDMGWRVDLYCVRPPAASQFRLPQAVRLIALSDRLLPRFIVEGWRRRHNARMARWVRRAMNRYREIAVGIWFGVRQLRRAVQLAYAVNLARHRRGDWDIVIASDVFALPAGLAAGRRRAFRIYDATEIPDLRERTSPYLRLIPASLRLPFHLMERVYVARAGLVTATSHALARYLRRRYPALPQRSIIGIRNGAAPERAGILARAAPSLRRRLGLAASDCLIVSPCGISPETGALVAARMLRFLPANHVLLFMGRFSNRAAEAELRSILRRQRLQHRCFFLGERDYDVYLRDLSECDVGLVLFDPAIGNLRLAAPNRFFDLVAAGVPIVATDIEEVAPILRRTGTGIVVAERRPAAVARAVLALRARLATHPGGGLPPRVGVRLGRLASANDGAREQARFIAALEAAMGPLAGKRVALMTLRNAASNRRFLGLGAALVEAGAVVDAFDTSIGAPAGATASPHWLTTLAIR
jgi:glycosyltransferase involved in cell wall biosynthesis